MYVFVQKSKGKKVSQRGLALVQVLRPPCAESNWWITYVRKAAFE